MIPFFVALTGFGVAFLGWLVVAGLERRGRLSLVAGRPDLVPRRARWGGGPLHPPARNVFVRLLADVARQARARSGIPGQRIGLRVCARIAGLVALGLGFSLLPVAGTWGGAQDAPLVSLDPDLGFVAILLVLLGVTFSRVAIGLADHSPWSRIGSARQATRSLAGTALLVLILIPLAVDAGSLRIHDVVVDQQQLFRPVAVIARAFGPNVAASLAHWPLPAWNLFAQPLTALLFAAAISLWLASPRAETPSAGGVHVAGLGLDADPGDTWWLRVEARLATVFASALFVTFFLGAGDLPFVETAFLLGLAEPYFGVGVSAFVVTLLQVGAFVVKMLFVLLAASRLGRMTAASRDDRSLRLATRRLLPLAWANLLLVTAVSLWLSAAAGGAS